MATFFILKIDRQIVDLAVVIKWVKGSNTTETLIFLCIVTNSCYWQHFQIHKPLPNVNNSQTLAIQENFSGGKVKSEKKSHKSNSHLVICQTYSSTSLHLTHKIKKCAVIILTKN